MTFAFLHPWWLLLLGLWPLLLILVRVREERRDHAAADFLLWRRAAAKLPEAKARAKMSWRDLAWLAPLVLLTAGLAAPVLTKAGGEAEVLVLADPSASMETRGPDGTTRHERGLREAGRILGSRPFRVEAPRAGLSESAILFDASGTPVLVVTDRPQRDLAPGVGLVQVTDGARNAGIVAAGFDPEAGLLVRVEADPGAGARTLSVKDGSGREIAREALADPTSVRTLHPAQLLSGATPPVVIRLEPPDALPLDDEVTLSAAPPPVRVAIQDGAPPSVERALRACPGVEVVHGDDPRAVKLLVAPLSGTEGFATGPAAARQGGLSGPSPFEGLDGPMAWKGIFPLVKQPAGTETLLAASGAPVLVRNGKTFVLLANPDENGWSSVPGFPLTIARLVEVAGGLGGTRLVPAKGALLSPAATHVMRGDAPPPRAPALRVSAASPVALAPWCFAAAAVIMAALLAVVMLRLRKA